MTDHDALTALPDAVKAELIRLHEEYRMAALALTALVHTRGGRAILTDDEMKAAHGRQYWIARYPDGSWEVRTSTDVYHMPQTE